LIGHDPGGLNGYWFRKFPDSIGFSNVPIVWGYHWLGSIRKIAQWMITLNPRKKVIPIICGQRPIIFPNVLMVCG
jgi:hypothetical protein